MRGNKYTEPSEYIPKEIRKKYGLGEFNKDEGKTKDNKPKKPIKSK